MECKSCGKEIPSTAQVCPFCLAPIETKKDDEEVETLDESINIDSNLTTISSLDYNRSSNDLNFGDLTNTSYADKKDTLVIEEKKKKKKRSKLPLLIILIILLAIPIAYLIMNLNKKVDGSKYYISFVDDVFDYIDNKLLSSEYKGTYRLYYKLGEAENNFSGSLQLNTNNKQLYMTGEIRITDPSTGLVTDNSGVGFNLHADGSNIYFNAPTIMDYTLLLPYDDLTNFMNQIPIDASNVSKSLHKAINAGLKDMNYSYEKNVQYEVDGTNKKVNKIVLKLDNPTKKKFIATFYTTLINEEDFQKEFSKINNIELNDVKKVLQEKMTSTEQKYAYDSERVTYINYYYDDNNSYGFEVDMTKDAGNKYFISYENHKFNIIKYSDNNETFNLIITRKEDETNKVIYSIEGNLNDEKLNAKMEITKNDNTNIVINEPTNIKNIRNLNTNDLATIKLKLQTYIKHTDWLDKLPKIFSISCKRKDLKCDCTRKTCNCTDGTYTTVCSKDELE